MLNYYKNTKNTSKEYKNGPLIANENNINWYASIHLHSDDF